MSTDEAPPQVSGPFIQQAQAGHRRIPGDPATFAGRVYATAQFPAMGSHTLWHCEHEHPSAGGADMCAEQEIASRRLFPPLTQAGAARRERTGPASVWAGRLFLAGASGAEQTLWTCGHPHLSVSEASDCAQDEYTRRAGGSTGTSAAPAGRTRPGPHPYKDYGSRGAELRWHLSHVHTGAWTHGYGDAGLGMLHRQLHEHDPHAGDAADWAPPAPSPERVSSRCPHPGGHFTMDAASQCAAQHGGPASPQPAQYRDADPSEVFTGLTAGRLGSYAVLRATPSGTEHPDPHRLDGAAHEGHGHAIGYEPPSPEGGFWVPLHSHQHEHPHGSGSDAQDPGHSHWHDHGGCQAGPFPDGAVPRTRPIGSPGAPGWEGTVVLPSDIEGAEPVVLWACHTVHLFAHDGTQCGRDEIERRGTISASPRPAPFRLADIPVVVDEDQPPGTFRIESTAPEDASQPVAGWRRRPGRGAGAWPAPAWAAEVRLPPLSMSMDEIAAVSEPPVVGWRKLPDSFGTASLADEGERWAGELNQLTGEQLWQCDHRHPSPGAAERCAEQERLHRHEIMKAAAPPRFPGYQAEEGGTFRARATGGAVVWECPHHHTSPLGAVTCARQEIDRQAAPDTEGTGNKNMTDENTKPAHSSDRPEDAALLDELASHAGEVPGPDPSEPLESCWSVPPGVLAELAGRGPSQDVHRLAASIIFAVPEAEVTKEQRQAGKIMNFAVARHWSTGQLAEHLGESLTTIGTWARRYSESGLVVTFYPGRAPVAVVMLDEEDLSGIGEHPDLPPDFLAEIRSTTARSRKEGINPGWDPREHIQYPSLEAMEQAARSRAEDAPSVAAGVSGLPRQRFVPADGWHGAGGEWVTEPGSGPAELPAYLGSFHDASRSLLEAVFGAGQELGHGLGFAAGAAHGRTEQPATLPAPPDGAGFVLTWLEALAPMLTGLTGIQSPGRDAAMADVIRIVSDLIEAQRVRGDQ